MLCPTRLREGSDEAAHDVTEEGLYTKVLSRHLTLRRVAEGATEPPAGVYSTVESWTVTNARSMERPMPESTIRPGSLMPLL